MQEQTQAHKLSMRALDLLLSRFPELRERTGASGVYELLLDTEGKPCGKVRLFEGERIARVVYICIDHTMVARHVPGAPLGRVDSHMIFAFTPAQSAVPHFTLDSIYSFVPPMPEPVLAYHLDLIPRVDVGAHLAYMDRVYGGDVNEAYAKTRSLPGFVPPSLTPRQIALMSPWMLAHRATPEAFAQIPMEVYLDRFCELVEAGVPSACVSSMAREGLAERDSLNRSILFNPEVDPVWTQVERVIGAETGQRLRSLLKEQGPRLSAEKRADHRA